MATVGNLERGREAYGRRAWGEAYRLLSLADREGALSGRDLELLSTCAYLIRRDGDHRALLERAHHRHAEAGDGPRAARCAFWLGFTLFLRGEAGQSSGWFARARRWVEGRDCVEHGYLLLPEIEGRLRTGRTAEAHGIAVEAGDIADRFGDRDLLACARQTQGRALIGQQQARTGLARLDEAMLAAVAGELSPIVTGLIYCSVIEACQQVFAFGRAREWTTAMAHWCEQQPELVAFTGTCLVHRAEVLQIHGAWSDAMTEALRACEGASLEAGVRPPPAAHYRRGELCRLRGEFDAAEEAYRAASRAGLEPQPGLALLRLAQGRTAAAAAAIRRVLGTEADPLERVRLLPACVEIMLGAGEVPEARRASDELAAIAGPLDNEALRAMAAHARGAVELAEGRALEALGSLRQAFDTWQRVEAPYEAACVRGRIAAACRCLGDDEAAELEVSAARAVLERLGAAPDIARLESAGRDPAPPPAHPLTRRELQVLQMIAAGRTNKAIASELFLSERTIDRHVSNLLAKLDVPSRAAAIAYAYQHRLL